jgi:hypothetical protein
MPTSLASTGLDAQTMKIRSASRNGKGDRRTEWTTLNRAVFAPIPSARVTMTMAENSGRRQMARSA